MDYESLVVTTCAVMVGSTEVKSIVMDKKLTAKPVVAGFGLGVFLFIIGIAREDLGVKFCWFIIITALLINGGPLFSALSPNGTATRQPLQF
jgi:Na+-transporting NADH:ubiquinone oxidoreductase subunit NqrD